MDCFSFLTPPSLPGSASMTLANFHWLHEDMSSNRRRMSLTRAFLLYLVHFCRHWRFKRFQEDSFFHRIQELLAKNWTWHHLFQRWSSLTNNPGEGEIIVDLTVKIWFGVKGSGQDASQRLSVVTGLLLITAITLYRSVLREETSSGLGDCSKIDVKWIIRSKIIYRSVFGWLAIHTLSE